MSNAQLFAGYLNDCLHGKHLSHFVIFPTRQNPTVNVDKLVWMFQKNLNSQSDLSNPPDPSSLSVEQIMNSLGIKNDVKRVPMRPLGYYNPQSPPLSSQPLIRSSSQQLQPTYERYAQKVNCKLYTLKKWRSHANERPTRPTRASEREPLVKGSNTKFLDIEIAELITAHVEKKKLDVETKDRECARIHAKIAEHAKNKDIFVFSDYVNVFKSNSYENYIAYFTKLVEEA